MLAFKQLQYPAQTGCYKVSVKDKGLWQCHRFARLQISMDNPKHTGDKFLALTEWAATRFEHVTLIVSDTLQRHNIASNNNLDLEEAYTISLAKGDDWISHNAAAINALPNKTITRWDEWLRDPQFKQTHNLLKYLYDNVEDFRYAVDKKALDFCKRHAANLTTEFVLANHLRASVDYILEELSAFSRMFATTKAIDIYPGEWFKDIFDVLKERSDAPLLSGFHTAECLRVDFIRNHGAPIFTPVNS